MIESEEKKPFKAFVQINYDRDGDDIGMDLHCDGKVFLKDKAVNHFNGEYIDFFSHEAKNYSVKSRESSVKITLEKDMATIENIGKDFVAELEVADGKTYVGEGIFDEPVKSGQTLKVCCKQGMPIFTFAFE